MTIDPLDIVACFATQSPFGVHNSLQNNGGSLEFALNSGLDVQYQVLAKWHPHEKLLSVFFGLDDACSCGCAANPLSPEDRRPFFARVKEKHTESPWSLVFNGKRQVFELRLFIWDADDQDAFGLLKQLTRSMIEADKLRETVRSLLHEDKPRGRSR